MTIRQSSNDQRDEEGWPDEDYLTGATQLREAGEDISLDFE